MLKMKVFSKWFNTAKYYKTARVQYRHKDVSCSIVCKGAKKGSTCKLNQRNELYDSYTRKCTLLRKICTKEKRFEYITEKSSYGTVGIVCSLCGEKAQVIRLWIEKNKKECLSKR